MSKRYIRIFIACLSSYSMTVEKGGTRKCQYWDIDPEKKIRYRTNEEYAEHFLSLFKDSVKACLRSYGRVGATLSGGLGFLLHYLCCQRGFSRREFLESV